MSIFVVIAASGSGERFNSPLPKQFCVVDSDVAIRKVVKFFLSVPDISRIICVIGKNHLDLYREIFNNFSNNSKLLKPVFGENTRQKSVKNGLDALEKYKPSLVLIHDANRCFCDENLIQRIIEKLKNGSKAVIPVVDILDSVRLQNIGIDRNLIKLVQTPQGFDFTLIRSLHEKYKNTCVTDDAALCDLDGVKVDYVEGSYSNKKITTKMDICNFDIKVGFGYDVHKFSNDKFKKLKLFGTEIPGHPGLEAHSDGDVAIHSLVDAIFGALGIGSIGEHFPDSSDEFKNFDSKEFLNYARKKIKKYKGTISNIDVTIVCESPRITSFKDKMKNQIAMLLEIDSSLINIKGKTTEGLGFEGKSEGISCYSVISIKISNN